MSTTILPSVALEGPSGAGKTTLSRNLQASLSGLRIVVLPDYSQAVGGPGLLPRAPAETVEEELSAMGFLLDLDEQRWRQGQIASDGVDLVVMDRSVHTLLAHRFAVSQLAGFDAFSGSCQLASEHHGVNWPHLVLYVDTPQRLLSSRQSPNVPPEARIFVDPEYNALFRSYFIPTLRYTMTRTFVIDGSQSADTLLTDALAAMKEVLDVRAG